MALSKIPSRQLDLGPAQYFEPYPEEPAGNQIRVRKGWIKTSTSKIYVPEQATVAFLPVPLINQVRWDLVYIDPSGVVHVDQGSVQPIASPEFTSAPMSPAYSYPLAYVKVTETGAVIVTSSDVTDIRPQANTQEDREYTPNYVVMNGVNYNEAISALDNEADLQRDFSGRENAAQLVPRYDNKGAPQYSILNGDKLAYAIAKIDTELNRLKTWLAKTNLAETLPNYAPETAGYNIGLNDAAKVAIGKLDKALYDLTHNATKSKQGGDGLTQFYHITQQIFEALIAIGGYIPSGLNPFTSKQYVDAKVLAGVKIAHGRTGGLPVAPVGSVTVDLSAGTTTYGTYVGDNGFTSVHGVFSQGGAGFGGGAAGSYWDCTIAGTVMTCGFAFIGDITSGNIGHWLAVGK